MSIPYHWQYLPLLLQIVVALGLATGMMIASKYIGRHRNTAVKLSAYECGIVPVGDARARFSVRFYMVAMLFILFDIEVVFLYPWAAIYRQMLKENPGLILGSMLSFMTILFVGYIYAVKKGAFDWQRNT